jgi:hypothetical protein
MKQRNPLMSTLQTLLRRALPTVLALSAALPIAAQAQNQAGQIQHLQGMATAQQAGGPVRFMSNGDTVSEGDVITTTEKGFAVVAFTDGGKITLRPSTSFAIEKYAHNEGAEYGLMYLLKGGMRAVTGLINKRNPGGLQFHTVTATIGIRGTSFDARICGDDCRQEERTAQLRPLPAASAAATELVVARLVSVTGQATALQPGKALRVLQQGSPLYAGDEVKTGPNASAVVGFRDQSRLTLEAQTSFRITGFSYQQTQQSDNFALQLLKGSMRLFTGLIAKSQPKAVSVQTVVATIGIRGTGMDISCEGPCEDLSSDNSTARPDLPQAQEGLFMHTWLGLTYLNNASGTVDVPLESVGFVGRDLQPRLLAALPEFMRQYKTTRPDQETIDWDKLFGVQASSGADGLYLYVRDGHISLDTAAGRSDLGAGEGGFIGADNVPRLMQPIPRFLSDDPFPIPEQYVGGTARVLQLFGTTLGQPGQEICRL